MGRAGSTALPFAGRFHGCVAQGIDLALLQLTVLAGLQHTELDGTLGAAAQAHDL